MVTPVICQICKRPVSLESARIDEHGKAVHEECYVNALKALRLSPVDAAPPGDPESGA